MPRTPSHIFRLEGQPNEYESEFGKITKVLFYRKRRIAELNMYPEDYCVIWTGQLSLNHFVECVNTLSEKLRKNHEGTNKGMLHAFFEKGETAKDIEEEIELPFSPRYFATLSDVPPSFVRIDTEYFDATADSLPRSHRPKREIGMTSDYELTNSIVWFLYQTLRGDYERNHEMLTALRNKNTVQELKELVKSELEGHGFRGGKDAEEML